MTFTANNQLRLLCLVSIVFLSLLWTDSSFAADATGGGLPFDSWFKKVQNSVTGPLAFAAAIMGIVAAGVGLIFGGEINGFLKSILSLVLVLSFLVTAKNTFTAITGKGALIGANKRATPLILEVRHNA